MPTLYLPELLYAEGRAWKAAALLVDGDGRVVRVVAPAEVDACLRQPEVEAVRLSGKALLPGLANAHSHSFQRLFRGRAEGRAAGGDTFWTWREQMYRAAGFVTPDDVYDVARATFLEMLASGITVVGEFHYLHNDRDGKPYADPNELAHQVLRAAESVGIRICLLRTLYMRAGFEREPHAGQWRFYEDIESYLRSAEALLAATEKNPRATVGVAPHSVRAVPLAALKLAAEFAAERALPLHMHLSEQTGENEACVAEYGATPCTLMQQHGVLTDRTVLVHAIHMSEAEFAQVAAARARICSCPTTERNLGDGIFPADLAARLGIEICHGTDSQAQIDILEDARQNEYHLRLKARERGILDGIGGEAIGARLLRGATRNGYRALGLAGGTLAPGELADFFTADLSDMALLGMYTTALPEQAVFALSRAAVRDVAVAGQLVLRDGQHASSEEIRARYKDVQRRFVQGEDV